MLYNVHYSRLNFGIKRSREWNTFKEFIELNVNLLVRIDEKQFIKKRENKISKEVRCWSHLINQLYGVTVCLSVVKMFKINNGFEVKETKRHMMACIHVGLANVCCPHWNLILSILNRYHSFTNHWLLSCCSERFIGIKFLRICLFDFPFSARYVRVWVCICFYLFLLAFVSTITK